MKTVSLKTSQPAQANARSDQMTAFMRIAFTALACLMIAFTSAMSADAHPRKEAETEINYNENANRVEIIHRYRIHDSESTLHRVHGDTSLSIMTDPRAQALFGEYVESRFSISHNGQALPLELVGGEIEDGFVWIYQTTPEMPADGLYVMRSNELMDVHQDQTNIVHVRLHGLNETLIFTRSTPWATFRLDGSDTY